MKLYILYILSALCTSWLILFYLGISAGFASYVPIAALFGSIIMFALAAPILVYNTHTGAVIGSISCLLILPYSLLFVKHLFFGFVGKFQWSIALIMLPSILVLLSSYFSVRILFIKKPVVSAISTNTLVKALLAGIPIMLFLLYLIFYGRYWSWQIFNI